MHGPGDFPGLSELLDRFDTGQTLGLSRAITLVENQRPGYEALLDAVHPRVGHAGRVGITGPPGAGKSTLTAALARHYREAEQTVGIIAVDPSSPFTGGALLGDRIRMDGLATDPGIFIRSMASRGSPGGLAATTREVTDLVDAFGFDRILLETVGVGQSELEIASQADTTVVVLVPESGDGIQAMKSGLMEVADIYVVNKADRPGADRLRKDIRLVRGLGPGASPEDARRGWDPPIILTTGTSGEGIDTLVAELDRHMSHLAGTGLLKERRKAAAREHTRLVLHRLVGRKAEAEFQSAFDDVAAFDAVAGDSPYVIARRLAERILSVPERRDPL